jgi:molecular chaperone GrpE
MTKKMKEHTDGQESRHTYDNNRSEGKTSDDIKTENSTGENKVQEEVVFNEINIEEQPQNELTEKTEESKTPADYEKIINEWKDKYIRLSAEFDNYRKRTLKEKIELTKYANEELLLSLLSIVDDFEHGIKTLEQASDLDALKQGTDLIYNKFKDFLSQKGLKEIENLNAEFNTYYHEAVTKIQVQDKEKSGKIVDTIQKRYMLDGKVIRHSKVIIGE